MTQRVFLLALSLCFAGCASQAPAESPESPAPETTEAPDSSEDASASSLPAPSARVELEPTQGNQVTGSLVAQQGDGKVHLSGRVSGLKPNAEHGFHVHETGDCSAPDASSAGGHFNPSGHSHGQQGSGEHHLGDMNNLKANAEGVAELDVWIEGAVIGGGGASDVVGKAVIVHADRDDYTSQPAGNAGARVACGVIVQD